MVSTMGPAMARWLINDNGKVGVMINGNQVARLMHDHG